MALPKYVLTTTTSVNLAVNSARADVSLKLMLSFMHQLQRKIQQKFFFIQIFDSSMNVPFKYCLWQVYLLSIRCCTTKTQRWLIVSPTLGLLSETRNFLTSTMQLDCKTFTMQTTRTGMLSPLVLYL